MLWTLRAVSTVEGGICPDILQDPIGQHRIYIRLCVEATNRYRQYGAVAHGRPRGTRGQR